MATKAIRHVHKYMRINMSSHKIWACALPECNHYMPIHLEELVPGKASICWECGDKMILDLDNMKSDKPKCAECSGLKDIAKYLEEKGIV